MSSLANREPRIDVIVHLRDLSPSSSHQVVLKLHRKSVLGKVQHIEIGSAELVSQDTGGEEIKGEPFFTFGWTSKSPDALFVDAEWKKIYDAADITIHFISQVRSSILETESPVC